MNTTVKNEDVLANAVSQELKTDWRFEVAYDYRFDGQKLAGTIQRVDEKTPDSMDRSARLNLSSQYPSWRMARRQTGLVVYVSAFIGLITLITTASILSLRQLAEATRDKKNYQLLLLLGVPKKKIRQLVYRENALMFFPVLIITMMNSFFGFFLLSKYISNTNFWLPNTFIAILVVTYSFFYLLTVIFYRRTIEI